MSQTKYVLSLTPEQAIIVENACELYARLKIAQFDQIPTVLLDVQNVEDYCRRRDLANDLLRVVAGIIFGRNNYGLPDVKQDVYHHRAWDVYQVLRYTRSWHEHPEGNRWSVCFDKPLSLIGERLPECRVEVKEDDARKKRSQVSNT